MITIDGKQHIDWKPGITLLEVLTAGGILEPHLSIVLNGELVPSSQYADTCVPDDSIIKCIYIAQGG